MGNNDSDADSETTDGSRYLTTIPYQDEDWLRNEYVEKGRSTTEIATDQDVSATTINRWLDKVGIERTSPGGNSEPLKDRKWLHDQYVNKEQSQSDIGDELGVHVTTVGYWLDQHNIQSRSSPDGDIAQLKDGAWLREQYTENERSQQDIASELGVSPTTVRKWLETHDISIRYRAGNTEPLKDEQWMRNQYVHQQKTQQEIATDVGVGSSTVARWLNTHGISTEGRQGNSTDS